MEKDDLIEDFALAAFRAFNCDGDWDICRELRNLNGWNKISRASVGTSK